MYRYTGTPLLYAHANTKTSVEHSIVTMLHSTRIIFSTNSFKYILSQRLLTIYNNADIGVWASFDPCILFKLEEPTLHLCNTHKMVDI